MPKKNMTPEERKAFGEKMKAARAAKQTLNPGLGEEPKETISSQDDVAELKRQLAEVQAMLARMPNTPQASVGSHGMIGTVEKYIVDPKHYPNPTERLSSEARLQRFAFKENYELDFKIEVSSYETIDKVRMREPKFTLELHRIVFDEDTGAPTDGRYVVCRGIFHEDPQAALVVAREQGMDVDESNEKDFLDEMRYIRFRDWLMEAFYPPKSETRRNKKEMSVGGKLVEYFEINSENAQSIPFDNLRTKI